MAKNYRLTHCSGWRFLTEMKRAKNTQKCEFRPLFIIFGLYCLAYFLLLLNKAGFYWDDYFLHNHAAEDILKKFNYAGLPYFAYIHSFMGSLGNGIFPYRVGIFLVYLLSGIFLYYILSTVKGLSKNTISVITLIFLLLPVNNARIALIDFPYGLCLCLFFLAFWLLTQYLKKPTILSRILILTIFFCSFLTNSLLIFYAIPLLYICYFSVFEFANTGESCKNWGSCFVKNFNMLFQRYGDFILLPIVFFILKNTYYNSHGYNTIVPLKILCNLIYSIKTSICKPMVDLILAAGSHPFGLIFLVFLVMYLNFFKIVQVPKKQIWLWMALGILFWVLAVFPYAAVNKIPDPGSFESRHMLLIPLGFSFMVYAFFLLLAKIDTDVATGMCIVFIASCIVKNIDDQVFFLKDWFYQVALEENYKTNAFLRNYTTFIFHSDVAWVNRRTINFCEHTVRLKNVFGDQTRLMVTDRAELVRLKQEQHNTTMSYCFYEDWNYSKPINIYAMTTPIDFNGSYFVKMLTLMYEDDVLFRAEAKKLLHVTTQA